MGVMQEYVTGMTRSADEGRPDYVGYLSPFVLQRFGEYMLQNQVQLDGKYRSADNWKQGAPMERWLRGLWRHFLALCTLAAGGTVPDDHGLAMRGPSGMELALLGIFFGVQGMLLELLRERGYLGCSPLASPRSEE